MATKPAVGTRASTRTRIPATVIVSPAPTRTTRARAATTKAATSEPPAADTTKKSASRKPLLNRENSAQVSTSSIKAAPKQTTTRKPVKHANTLYNTDREPIMAYLRIRPRLNVEEPVSQPYLIPLSETAVRMTDPHDPQSNPSRFRPSTIPSSIYTFSHIFLPETLQSDFFTKTTLPLVQDVLQGQSGLLFAYGATNSGKTYTVQGGGKEGTAGILPRALDVIFNSIEGLHGNGKFRPVRLHGIEPADPTDSKPPRIAPEPALAEVLGQHLDVSVSDSDVDSTILKVDRNYEYTIWISYAEVYNEKVYDLLASVKDDSRANTDGNLQRMGGDKSLVLTRTALSLRPSPASDNMDSTTMSGKYIAGLRQFRVHSASQAKALVRLGQLHRRVFGTLANQHSSRSHGMVIVKVVRGHRGERNDPASLQISRLTLVDLAGSERTKHTHTTGDRLKEAGNINKSLMVLGQCMEVLRSNQRKLAMSLSKEGVGKERRVDTRDVKKTLAIVPFRHSKLTEALMDYFTGDGRAVMIVNVNPYDTGYDENSHVMKFAALAREVYVTPTPAPIHRLPSGTVVGPGKMSGMKIKQLGPLILTDPDIIPNPYRRKVTISMAGNGSEKKANEAVLEVLEEDEPNEGPEEDLADDEPINPLVDALFDEVENLRLQLFESEMRCAIIEAETREEVMREMEERMRNMEAIYSRRLMKELEQNEMKTDAKIDMLHQSGLFGSPTKRTQFQQPLSDTSEEDIEMSLVAYDQDEDNLEGGSSFMAESPLVKKGPNAPQFKSHHIKPKEIREVRKFFPDQPLPSDNEEAVLTATEAEDGEESMSETGITGSELDDDEDESESEYNEDEEDDDDRVASSANQNKTPRGKVLSSKANSSRAQSSPQRKTSATTHRLSKLQQQVHDLSLASPDDSVVILPVKKSRLRQHSLPHSEVDDDCEDMEIPFKTKKRQLGKKAVMTEEQIERAVGAVQKQVAPSNTAKNVRRLTGR